MTLQYAALDVDTSEIRLLTIAPGDYDSEICCSLSVDSLLRHPKFEALSYVWGDPSITKNILVDGTSHPVTVNLESALRDLRCTTMPRVIWADALCINQADLVEKNHQIPLLGDIYRNAYDVVAYLGPANPYLEYFLVWSHVYSGKWRRLTSRRWIKIIVQSWISRKGAKERAISIAQFFLGLRAFSSHPYFTRMWTFQEFLLPRRKPILVVGRNSFRVDHINGSAWDFMDTEEFFPRLSSGKYMKDSPLFCDVSTQIQRETNDWKPVLIQRLRLKQLFEEKRPACDLLFHATQSRDCFNPRDKIFALYSFIQEEFPDFCKPDYTKSVEQVLLETVSFFHENRDGSLPWFMSIFPLRASGYDHALCPSWLPDLTAKQLPMNYFQSFTMWSGPPPKAELSEDLLALTIKVRLLGKCNDSIIRFGTDANQTLRCIAKLMYPSKGDLDTVTQAAKVPRQQIAYASYSNHISGSFIRVDEVLSIYRTIAKYKDFTDFSDIPFSESATKKAAHVRAAAEKLANQVFFWTDTGMFGTCSGKLEVGDTIMMSPNFHYPFASRVLPDFSESSTQSYSLVEWTCIGGIDCESKDEKLLKELMKIPLESVSLR